MTVQMSGGVPTLICDPPLSRWDAIAAENRALVSGWSFDVEGVPAAALRARARRRVLELAGLEPNVERPLFVSGHQPVFYHPGIWIKAFAVTGHARRQSGQAVNLTVDQDAGELAAEVPVRLGHELRYVKEYLVRPLAGTPLETLPAPQPAQVDDFAARVEERLATLDWPEGLEYWRRFAVGLREAAGEADTAALLGVTSRRAYERAWGEELCPDLPISRVSQTPEFLLFFVHWAKNARALREAFNQALAGFRAAHQVRSPAVAFPDLLVRPDGAVELPFWGITPAGIRRKLYVQRRGGELEISHLEGLVARIPETGGEGAVEALLEAGVQIRPKAVPLTVFHRLFVADLFVHGTGGGRYDQVTDALIRDWFGVAPPKFAVVSASLYLPLGERPVPASALQAQRHKLRDIVFNPQRFAWEAGDLDESAVALVRRKEELISAINAPGAPKRQLTRKIEAVNAELYRALQPVAERARVELERLEARARSAAAALRRTYPFFLYAPARLWELLCAPAGVVQEGAGETGPRTGIR
ncbi:MAG: hypothetical protein BAA04_09145 [Firmicutes bacterium ZCTH02-B6]|nr:MAG: hypothetical protein BAA04_09145 [Firmicutes bacterium ZCTH02-B6]